MRPHRPNSPCMSYISCIAPKSYCTTDHVMSWITLQPRLDPSQSKWSNGQGRVKETKSSLGNGARLYEQRSYSAGIGMTHVQASWIALVGHGNLIDKERVYVRALPCTVMAHTQPPAKCSLAVYSNTPSPISLRIEHFWTRKEDVKSTHRMNIDFGSNIILPQLG